MQRSPELLASLSLDDLVANRTMSPEIAALLRSAAHERRSFLVHAIPRFAGKSTVTRAMLEHVPVSVPVRIILGDGSDVEHLLTQSGGGYIVIPEISEGAWAPGYIWGDPVRRVFKGLTRGISLAAALHAPDIEEAFAIICGANGVSDEDAGRLELVLCLRSIGADIAQPERRVVASVHEVAGVARGRAGARLLYRWDERADRFDAIEAPERIGHGR